MNARRYTRRLGLAALLVIAPFSLANLDTSTPISADATSGTASTVVLTQARADTTLNQFRIYPAF